MPKITLLLLTVSVLAQELPMVPGVHNPAVTQENIHKTICVSGWTNTVRPSASYTNKLKHDQMEALHYMGDPHRFEEDHRLPLELGGHPTDPLNLWPEPWHGKYNAHNKDRLENYVRKQVCSDKLTLQEGQHIFLTDFWKEYDRVFPGSINK